MVHQAAYPKIITDETKKELARHGTEEFPLGFYLEDIWGFDFHCVDWHWHPEVECIYVQEGTVQVLAGSSCFELPSGTGAFVNSQVIHSYRAREHALMPNFVFHAELLAPRDSLIYRNYLGPVLQSGVDIVVFRPDTAAGRKALGIIRELITCLEQEKPNQREQIKIRADTLADYFPKDFTPKQKVELIESLVKEWHEKQMVQTKPSVQQKLKKKSMER